MSGRTLQTGESVDRAMELYRRGKMVYPVDSELYREIQARAEREAANAPVVQPAPEEVEPPKPKTHLYTLYGVVGVLGFMVLAATGVLVSIIASPGLKNEEARAPPKKMEHKGVSAIKEASSFFRLSQLPPETQRCKHMVKAICKGVERDTFKPWIEPAELMNAPGKFYVDCRQIRKANHKPATHACLCKPPFTPGGVICADCTEKGQSTDLACDFTNVLSKYWKAFLQDHKMSLITVANEMEKDEFKVKVPQKVEVNYPTISAKFILKSNAANCSIKVEFKLQIKGSESQVGVKTYAPICEYGAHAALSATFKELLFSRIRKLALYGISTVVAN